MQSVFICLENKNYSEVSPPPHSPRPLLGGMHSRKIKSILQLCPLGYLALKRYQTLALPHLSSSFILVQRHKRPSPRSASTDAFRCAMTSFFSSETRGGKKVAASDQATDLKSSAKFPNQRAGLAAIVGLTISPLVGCGGCAEDATFRRSASIHRSFMPPYMPSPSAADRMRLCARMRLCLRDGGEGGGVPEPAPLRAPLEA